MSEKTVKQHTKWEKGESGNPLGRPKGARNKTTLAAEALLHGEAETLTRSCITQALAGNPVALRLCLERILPPIKDRPLELDISNVTTMANVLKALNHVLALMSQGTILPSEADKVAALLVTIQKTIESTELEDRVNALELVLKKRRG